jgi:hypothetical protein
VFFLDENDDVEKKLSFATMADNCFLWAQKLTQAGIEQAHNEINGGI